MHEREGGLASCAMRFTPAWGLLTCVVWSSGCGGPAEPAPTPKVETAPVATAEPEPVLPAPAPAPREIVALARVREPAATLTHAGAYTNLPLPWEDAVAERFPELASLLRFDRSLDIAAVLDPEVRGQPEALFGVSLALSDHMAALERLRASGHAVEQISPFMHYLTLEGDAECAIAVGSKPDSARLVCSEERRALDVLAPYMATTLPDVDIGVGDIRVVLYSEALRARYGKQANLIKAGVPFALRELAQGDPRFDAALAEVLHGLAGELVALSHELDTVSLELTFDSEPERLRAQVDVIYAGSQSWSAGFLSGLADDKSVATEHFWALPHDAGLVAFNAGHHQQAAVAVPLAALSELIASAAVMGGTSNALLDDWKAAFEAEGLLTGDTVSALGVSGEPGRELAYVVSGLPEDGSVTRRYLETTIAVLNDKSLRKLLKEKAGEDFGALPAITKARTPSGLPQGTVAYSLDVDAQLWRKTLGRGTTEALLGPAPKKGERVRKNLLLVPAGERCWLLGGGELELLAQRAKFQLAPQPAESTLATRPGLEELKSVPSNAQLATSARGMLQLIRAERGLDSATTTMVLQAMPNRGETPMTLRFQTFREGDKVRASWVGSLPRTAAEDLAAASLAGIAQATASPAQ